MKLLKLINSADDAVYTGYWISPSGKVIGVESDHFLTIWSQPMIFGLNRDNMHELYNKYSSEDETIRQIINDLIEQGWIKCQKKTKYWHAQVYVLSRKTTDRIWEWAYNSLNGTLSKENPWHPVKIYEIYSGHTLKTTFGEMLTGDFVQHITTLSARIQKFIERHLDYFLDEYLEMEEYTHESHRH